jgi:hypothetical protein
MSLLNIGQLPEHPRILAPYPDLKNLISPPLAIQPLPPPPFLPTSSRLLFHLPQPYLHDTRLYRSTIPLQLFIRIQLDLFSRTLRAIIVFRFALLIFTVRMLGRKVGDCFYRADGQVRGVKIY